MNCSEAYLNSDISPMQDDLEIEMDEEIKVIGKASDGLQESLESEVIPDPMEGEQTWPDDEELREAEGKK